MSCARMWQLFHSKGPFTNNVNIVGESGSGQKPKIVNTVILSNKMLKFHQYFVDGGGVQDPKIMLTAFVNGP